MEESGLFKIALYRDRQSSSLESRIIPRGTIKIRGVLGYLDWSCLLAYLQIFPVIHGKIIGLTAGGLWTATETVDFSQFTFEPKPDDDYPDIDFNIKELARSCIKRDAFKRIVNTGHLRMRLDRDRVPVYFPTAKYLEFAGLIPIEI